MNRLISVVKALLLSLWLGGGLFLMFFAAPAAFRTAQNRTAAANMVGGMLSSWHYISIVVPLLFLLAVLRRPGSSFRALLLSAALILGAAQIFADLHVRSIRARSPVAISELSPSDPARRHFGRFHALSSLLMLLQVVAATGVVASELDIQR
ncbi:MAG: DUF4149 domain-containing protein [Acidobacteriota bacterium]